MSYWSQCPIVSKEEARFDILVDLQSMKEYIGRYLNEELFCHQMATKRNFNRLQGLLE